MHTPAVKAHRPRPANAGGFLSLLLLALGTLACVKQPLSPIVIGHRGASGYRPEHTLPAYELAIAQGADFIEPDLVPTRDGVLIARHENELADTTDVATRFPERKTQKIIDGERREGFFAEDFTLAEIKTLRAKERLPFRSHDLDGQLSVPTLAEVLELLAQKRRELSRPLGIYPELKHAAYFAAQGFHVEETLLQQLAQAGFSKRTDPVFIQSFEPLCLKKLRSRTQLRLIQLLDEARQRPYDFIESGDPRTFGDLVTPAGLDFIKSYADGIGVHKALILPLSADGRSGQPSPIISAAHARKLLVHVYTLRKERVFIPPDFDAESEPMAYIQLGVDGLFCDFPDLCVQARAAASRGR